jgi:hypothetical protein
MRVMVYIGTVALALATIARGVDSAKAHKQQVLVIEQFTVQDGVNFPIDWLATLQEELLQQMQKATVFKEVLRPGEKPSDADAPTLQLTGKVINFNAGSRAKRYVLGPGFGKTKIVAHIQFLEQSSGKIIFETNVDGRVFIGFIGGDSIGATRGLAKEVAGDAKKKL